MVGIQAATSQCRRHRPSCTRLSGDNSFSYPSIVSTTCQVFTHSNIIAFDGTRYDLHNTLGTFLLFQGADDHKSHVRLWNCNYSSFSEVHNVSCACGLVVREGNEVAEVDMCDTKHLNLKLPIVRLESLTGESVQTRVSEIREGKSLRFEFRSGRVLTVHLETWGMSLTLQTTGGDLEKARLKHYIDG